MTQAEKLSAELAEVRRQHAFVVLTEGGGQIPMIAEALAKLQAAARKAEATCNDIIFAGVSPRPS